MKTISVEQFCTRHDISQSFIDDLFTFELVEVLIIERSKHIKVSDINKIDRLKRIHYDLDVNFEGLDVINNMMDEIIGLNKDIIDLKNRISFFE